MTEQLLLSFTTHTDTFVQKAKKKPREALQVSSPKL